MRAIHVKLLGAILVILGASAPAFGQDSEKMPKMPPAGPFVFLEGDKISVKPDNSYLFQHTDGKLVFEAQIAPDVRIVDTFGKAAERALAPDRPRLFAYAIYGTFLTRLRMFDEDSNPVRTPSYMPKASIQFAWLKNLSTKDVRKQNSEFNQGPIEMWLVHTIPFGHHSNGQNGCLFRGQVRIDGECEPKPDDDADLGPADVNTENGSFSTNYVRAGLEYRRLHTAGDDDIETLLITNREWGIGGSVEFHPSGYLGGSISDSLRPLYGATRFQVAADAIARNWKLPILPGRRVTCGRAWINSTVTFLKGASDVVEPVIATVEAACQPARWGGSGLFVRYYYGQDYYNASFLENINRFQIGVTFLPGKFLSFNLHRTPAS